jgi:hypothetical protein
MQFCHLPSVISIISMCKGLKTLHIDCVAQSRRFDPNTILVLEGVVKNEAILNTAQICMYFMEISDAKVVFSHY